jgi:hypothetical protein
MAKLQSRLAMWPVNISLDGIVTCASRPGDMSNWANLSVFGQVGHLALRNHRSLPEWQASWLRLCGVGA